VDTRAYSPTRNIFADSWSWPKTRSDFAVFAVRLAAIWRGLFRKAMVALDLAVTATRKGRTAAVIDVDPQATASKWTDRRASEQPWVVPTHAVRLAAAIEQAKTQGVDFIVIDTPPHSATDAAEAAHRANVVMAPIEPHVFALETVSKLADLLKLAGNLSAFFVINKAPTQGTEGANVLDYIKRQGFSVCPVILHLRAARRHAGNVGKVAAEYDAETWIMHTTGVASAGPLG
jgi:chromosome partitioning protein